MVTLAELVLDDDGFAGRILLNKVHAEVALRLWVLRFAPSDPSGDWRETGGQWA